MVSVPDALTTSAAVTAVERRADRIAVVMGLLVTVAGITHFTNPGFFDELVPPWLPPGERFWTYTSGVAELVVGPALLWRRTRRAAGWGAVALFVAVFPGNLYMAWDWRDRSWQEQLVAWFRLPWQFLFIALAVQVARHAGRPET
jgi:uncharacterized membrane protein